MPAVQDDSGPPGRSLSGESQSGRTKSFSGAVDNQRGEQIPQDVTDILARGLSRNTFVDKIPLRSGCVLQILTSRCR